MSTKHSVFSVPIFIHFIFIFILLYLYIYLTMLFYIKYLIHITC